MSGLLKWNGDVLRLGKTVMAEVRTRAEGLEYDYVIGPKDFVSEPFKSREAARQACEAHVRELLKAAGVDNP